MTVIAPIYNLWLILFICKLRTVLKSCVGTHNAHSIAVRRTEAPRLHTEGRSHSLWPAVFTLIRFYCETCWAWWGLSFPLMPGQERQLPRTRGSPALPSPLQRAGSPPGLWRRAQSWRAPSSRQQAAVAAGISLPRAGALLGQVLATQSQLAIDRRPFQIVWRVSAVCDRTPKIISFTEALNS